MGEKRNEMVAVGGVVGGWGGGVLFKSEAVAGLMIRATNLAFACIR